MIGGVVIISLITLVTSSQLMITSTTQVANADGGVGKTLIQFKSHMVV
jgi:hypothetical protein